MTLEGDEQTDDDFWDALGDRAVHPVRVEIIEALRWIDVPTRATDLPHVFNGKRIGLQIEHHFRQLTRLGIVERDKECGAIPYSYRLAE